MMRFASISCVIAVLACVPDVSAQEKKTELDNEVRFMLEEHRCSEAELDVWKTVKGYWDVSTAEELIAYFHDDYIGWNDIDAMPCDKEAVRLQFTDQFNIRTPLLTIVSPNGMRLHGDIAIVTYHFSILYKDADGKRQTEKGRYTDVLKKEKGKWLIIADHGGPCE